MASGLSKHHGLIRGTSGAALGLAVIWFFVSPGFEPVITALLGLAGLMSTLLSSDGSEAGVVGAAALSVGKRRTGLVPMLGDPRSVAVLPLKNIGGDPDNEFFSDGLTEDLIAQLCRIPGLKVISRTSVMRFKETSADLREIASSLNAGSVLEGSVRREEGRIRVVAQLIDARTDQHLWAETYDRDLKNVFQIQSEIALHVAEALQASLSPDREEKIRTQPTQSLDAHDALLLGRHHWWSATEKGARKAKDYFEQALESDPDYAQAHAWLAYWYAMAGGASFGLVTAAEAIPRAKVEAQRAIALDPDLGDAYGTLAVIEGWYYWEWDRAEKVARNGVERDPNSYLAWFSYAHVLGPLGKHDECLKAVDCFVGLDPLSVATLGNAAMHYCHAGRMDEALTFVKRLEEIDSGFWGAVSASYVLQARGENSEALARLNRVQEDWSKIRSSSGAGMLAYAVGRAGNRAEFDRSVADLQKRAEEGRASWTELAIAYMGVHDHERALEYLEKEPEQQLPGGDFTAHMGVIPHFAPIRDGPRFQRVLKRLGLV